MTQPATADWTWERRLDSSASPSSHRLNPDWSVARTHSSGSLGASWPASASPSIAPTAPSESTSTTQDSVDLAEHRWPVVGDDFDERAWRFATACSKGEHSADEFVAVLRALALREDLALNHFNAVILDCEIKLPHSFAEPTLDFSLERHGVVLASMLKVLLKACGLRAEQIDPKLWPAADLPLIQRILRKHRG